MQEMPTRYDAISTESKWYLAWEAAGLFSPNNDDSRESYTITIPPPNITGSLHMGHALCYPIQDTIGRYQRLRGKNVLVLPGQDHAGIATQTVVDRELRKNGESALTLGREKFIEKVWEWRELYGGKILEQFRAFGCAYDWNRNRFTLDQKYADAVLQVFINWFERGIIFRGKRVVNWDPTLKTNVSDIETERKTVKGHLYHIRYYYADRSGYVVIATTRPETLLADVAVAVHPSDVRYQDRIGTKLIVPIVDREVPLIADMYPDPTFGTGAVKITPAHDPNDYEVGVRHQLPMPVILDESARIRLDELGEVSAKVQVYAGLDRAAARKLILADLEEAGLLERIEEHEIPILVSDRSKDVIEPLLSEQWFADQSKLAQPVIEAVRKGDLKFFPERYERIFIDWLENIRPWNISRQLWWGHRVPVYYTESGEAFAALSWEDAQRKAGNNPIVRQDDDVLDTWFSSGLWPFATLGWPEQTEDLKRFYPTQVLITDRNIINLWVARMAFMGLGLLGKLPFSEVMIYATVLTEDGKRMSKSLGTGVDPMGVIQTLGADILRWTLQSQTGENQDIRYSEKRNEESRNFANKIWNATRFVLMNVNDVPPAPSTLDDVDRWLLSRLTVTEKTVREAFDRYDLQSGCSALYRFFWNELCDWYIEVSKNRLANEATRAVPQWVLLQSFEAFLTMLHPIMPHLTEELYAFLPLKEKASFLMSSTWPELPAEFAQPDVEAKIERIFEITRAARALRASVDIPAIKFINELWVEGDLQGLDSILSSQAWASEVLQGRPATKHISTTTMGVTVHLPIAEVADLEKQITRLEKDIEKGIAEIDTIEKRLANPQFVKRAKPEVIERDRQNMQDLAAQLQTLKERLRVFS
jgi:valyl-tRNA synthetase